MDTATLTTLLMTLIPAVIGGYISFYFASKAKKDEAIIKFREEKYTNLLILLQGFVGDTANYQTKIKFFEEQYKSWIYASDEVVIAVNELIDLVKNNNGQDPNPLDGEEAIGKVVLAMRKDLLKKTSLGREAFVYTSVR